MEIRINGREQLKAKIKALPQIIQEATWQATLEIVEEITSRAVSNVQSSVRYGSGEGAGSIKQEVVIDSQGKIVGRVWSDKQEMLFREFGTGPVGEESPKDLPPGITPVYSQERWFIPADKVAVDLEVVYGIPKITIQGKEFFMTRGQPARPWLYPAVKEVEAHIPEIFQDHVKESLRKL